MAVTNNRLASQAVWIGAGIGTMDESTLSYPGQLGMVVIKNGLAYQLVQFKSTTTTITAGTPVGWTDKDDFVVSAKQTDLNRNAPAGFATGTQTAAYYGWIQVDGPATVTVDGASYSAGDSLILASSTDGQAIKVAAGTAPTYATLGIVTATIALAAGTGAAYIQCPHNGW